MSNQLPFNFLSDCSEATLKAFNLATMNRIDMLEKAQAEILSELTEEKAKLEAAQQFIKYRPEIIEALRTQAMKEAITIEPQRAERPRQREVA